MRKLHLTGMVVIAVLLAGAAQAQSPTRKIAGDVVKVDGDKLEVKSTAGQVVDVKLTDKVRLSARSPTDASKLTRGEFVGATAVPQADGTLRASEVHIFAESMRGTGEGHRPMDNDPGSTMTNATIANVGGAAQRNTMTNATVADVAGTSGERRLILSYKGGEKTIVVPENVPILTVEPADRSLLAPGTHVIVYAAPQADGALAAERVSIGKNGYVPPL